MPESLAAFLGLAAASAFALGLLVVNHYLGVDSHVG